MQRQNKIDLNDIFTSDSKTLLRKEQILQYKCPVCKHLLDDPLQAECGDRFCSDCFKSTFTKKLVNDVNLECFSSYVS